MTCAMLQTVSAAKRSSFSSTRRWFAGRYKAWPVPQKIPVSSLLLPRLDPTFVVVWHKVNHLNDELLVMLVLLFLGKKCVCEVVVMVVVVVVSAVVCVAALGYWPTAVTGNRKWEVRFCRGSLRNGSLQRKGVGAPGRQ